MQENEIIENEVIEDQEQEEDPVTVAEEQQSEPDQNDDEEGEVVITIGDQQEEAEPDTSQAPDWVKKLRQEHKELRRENRELKARQQQAQAADPAIPKLGAKPTLEGHDYDAEAFEAAMDQWYAQKRLVDEAEAKVRTQKETAEKEWQAKINQYQEAKQNLRVPDYDDSEEAIQNSMDVTQQGIILQGADNPATLVYALGKNQAKLKELAAIKDPVKFAFAVAKLETQIKMSTKPKSAPPAPERRVSGDGGTSGTVDSELARLRADAEKTNDYTKVNQYRAMQRAKMK